MTEITFHFNVGDKLNYACRLLRKIYNSGASVRVLASEQMLGALDQLLWSFSQLEFIPHCLFNGPQAVLAHTPVVLALDCTEDDGGQILVNLATQVPLGFARYARLIELVSQDDADRVQARQRWRHYAERGYSITQHDALAQQSRGSINASGQSRGA